MIDENLNSYSAKQLSCNENELNTSQSRRQLFPSLDDEDIDDFSYITPLNTSVLSPCSSVTSTDFELQLSNSEENYLIFSRNSIQDYIIIENIYDATKDANNSQDSIRTPQSEKFTEQINEVTMSPLFLSPAQIVPQSIASSPKKNKQKSWDLTETQDLLVNTVANQLIRNYSMDESPSSMNESGREKSSFSSAFSTKQLDQVSKARTELFPKDPTPSSNNNKTAIKKKAKSPQIYLCGSKINKKKAFGQINGGVRHKIKRPKIKKASKDEFVKSAIDILQNSPLNDYLKSNENINFDFSKKQIQPLITPQPLESTLGNSENVMPKMKRPASSPVPEIPKKFFKSNRNAVVMDDHLNFKVNRETPNFGLTTNVQDEFDLNLDASDLVEPDKENLIPSETIDNIVQSLGNDNDSTKNDGEHLVLKAHNSVAMSENSIHLHVPSENAITYPIKLQKQVIDKSILLSPTSQMCNMTSGLALNSPTRNQSRTLIGMQDSTSDTSLSTGEKLYPIFCGKQNTCPNNLKAPKTSVMKKLKPLSKNQLLLDLGQKKFGATQCTACKFVYHMGDPNDELIHLHYHNAGSILRFGGWKDERVVSQLGNAKIIKVVPGDPKPWLKKVKELVEVINRDLGYYEMPVVLDNTQIFLYIKKQIIVGCLVAEPKSTAYKLLSDNVGIDLCSELNYPVKCGVNRIWVSQGHRKEGIATSLLNSLRGNFMYGYILTKEDIALSSPTESGKAFAIKYFNTPNFLIYT